MPVVGTDGTTPSILQPLKDELVSLQTKITANTAGVTQLSTDLQSLLAKIGAGGTITAADVQPLVDQAKAMEGSVDASVAEEAAADASVPKS